MRLPIALMIKEKKPHLKLFPILSVLSFLPFKVNNYIIDLFSNKKSLNLHE